MPLPSAEFLRGAAPEALVAEKVDFLHEHLRHLQGQVRVQVANLHFHRYGELEFHSVVEGDDLEAHDLRLRHLLFSRGFIFNSQCHTNLLEVYRYV